MCFSAGTLFSLPIYGKSLLTGVEHEFLTSFSKEQQSIYCVFHNETFKHEGHVWYGLIISYCTETKQIHSQKLIPERWVQF